MYRFSVKQWNIFVGCNYDCIYCEKSFKAQLKRQKNNCIDCYNYMPHEHNNRLANSLPNTSYLEFIFVVSHGDISFCSTGYFNKIIDVIKDNPNKTFLIQSKNPETFNRISKYPRNVILGTTLETDDDDLYKLNKISDAPLPSRRYHDFKQIKHKTKMVTIEPIIRFTPNFINWIEDLNPVVVWLGYDSKNCNLPEPDIKDFWELFTNISRLYIPVILKTVRQGDKQ